METICGVTSSISGGLFINTYWSDGSFSMPAGRVHELVPGCGVPMTTRVSSDVRLVMAVGMVLLATVKGDANLRHSSVSRVS